MSRFIVSSLALSWLVLFLLVGLTAASAQVNATNSSLSAQATSQVTFSQNTIASGSTNTYSIAAGDFNNDGILDLVTVNRSTLSFFKGLGGGKYAAPVNQSLPLDQGGYGQVFAADLNQDGKLDVAIAWGVQSGLPSGGVTILLGNGDGIFTQGTNINVSGNAAAIALADFNGDHKPDIAVSDAFGNGTTWIYLGNGDGTFTLSDTHPYGGLPFVVGDVNADGKQDLVYANGLNIGLFLGDGNGTLAAPIIASTSAGINSLAVGDFYNNRVQTLVALASLQNSQILEDYIYSLRYSNGVLYVENQSLIFQSQDSTTLLNVAGGDLNGDFKFDIFLSGSDVYEPGLNAYMLGNGDGTFQPLQYAPYALYTNYQSPLIRDLNRDSREDVALAWNNISTVTAGAEVLLNKNATQNCNPPPANKLSVHICAPTNGQTVGSRFTFVASGNAFNGVAKRMELWIDHKKIGQNLEDQLNVTTNLATGTHTAWFVVVDSFDSHASQSVTFTSSY